MAIEIEKKYRLDKKRLVELTIRGALLQNLDLLGQPDNYSPKLLRLFATSWLLNKF